MMKKTYTIPSEHIWYSPETNTSSRERIDKTQIKFDSRAEFEFYRSILPLSSSFGFNIFKDCKLTFEGKTWLVDFKLVFQLSDIPLVNGILTHLNGYFTEVELPILHVEYKGVLTNQSCDKLDLLARSSYDKSLVMVSDKPLMYIKENLTSLTVTRKAIHSQRFFIAVLTKHILNWRKSNG
jgi:hypothetical protein